MSHRMSATPFALAPLLLTLGFAGAGAQELQAGTWTGTMVPPEGIPAPVAFEVVNDGRLSITMTVEGTAPRPLETILLDGDLLTFSFNMVRDQDGGPWISTV